MLSGGPGQVAAGLWLVVGLFLGSSWLLGSVWREPAVPLVAETAGEVPPLTVLRADQVEIAGMGSEPEKTQLRERLVGRLALRRLAAGTAIDPDRDVSSLTTPVPTGSRVVALAAADPFGQLRVGDVVDLVLVPAPPIATPSSNPTEDHLRTTRAQTAGKVDEILIVQVGPTSPGGTVPILAAVPEGQVDVLREFVGRVVAHPLYSAP